MPSYREECEACTKAALTIIGLSILGPLALVILIGKYGFFVIKNHYYPSDNHKLSVDHTPNDDEWFDVETIGDAYDSIT